MVDRCANTSNNNKYKCVKCATAKRSKCERQHKWGKSCNLLLARVSSLAPPFPPLPFRAVSPPRSLPLCRNIGWICHNRDMRRNNSAHIVVRRDMYSRFYRIICLHTSFVSHQSVGVAEPHQGCAEKWKKAIEWAPVCDSSIALCVVSVSGHFLPLFRWPNRMNSASRKLARANAFLILGTRRRTCAQFFDRFAFGYLIYSVTEKSVQ